MLARLVSNPSSLTIARLLKGRKMVHYVRCQRFEKHAITVIDLQRRFSCFSFSNSLNTLSLCSLTLVITVSTIAFIFTSNAIVSKNTVVDFNDTIEASHSTGSIYYSAEFLVFLRS